MRSLSRSIMVLVGVLAMAWLPAKPLAAQDEADGDGESEESAAPPPTTAPTDKRPGTSLVMNGDGSGAVHAEGDYGGVVPGKARKVSKAKLKASLVSWIGFQAQAGGGARVFVQLAREVAYEQSLAGDALVVRLRGVKLGTRTHGRFIDTTFFATGVTRVEAKNLRGGKGVELTVHFKKGGAAKADARFESAADGATYLYLDFAP